MAWRIGAISGSLRNGSRNRALIEAARGLVPRTIAIEHVEIGGLPMFNEDLEAEGWPPGVDRLRDRVAGCDGLLFACPEYNHSLPGGLKNAIDWLSRPKPQDCPLWGKPVAVIGASSGKVGTARAQAQLREVLTYLGMPVLPGHEVLVGPAEPAFEDDRLTDEKARQLLAAMLAEFDRWLERHVPAARQTHEEGTDP